MSPIDETRSPAARQFNETQRRLQLALAEFRREMEEDARFLSAMARRPLTRPESRINHGEHND